MKFTFKAERGETLCSTCGYGQVIKGVYGQQITYCGAGSFSDGKRIDFPVLECSKYYSATSQNTLQKMEEQATIIINKRGGEVGFMTPKEFREKNGMDKWESLTGN